MKNLILAVTLLILVGCSPFNRISPDVVLWKSYEIDKRIEKSTGSVMIDLSYRFFYPTFEPLFIQELPDGTLAPGQQWIAFHVLDSDKSKYILTSKQVNDEDIGIIVNHNGEIFDEQPIINHMKKRPFREPWIRMPLSKSKATELFVRLRDGSTSPPINTGLSAELIYSGVMNKIIVITYREFINDMARPAFYQELKYDLNNTDIIVFRSIKIKVLEANNSNIVFQVLDDGSLPWMYRQ